MKDYLTATEIAQMASCEYKAYLTDQLGDLGTREMEQAKSQGNLVHARAEAIGNRAYRSDDRRCFIATCVFGADATETNVLRAWRDRELTKTWGGRCLIQLYYRSSPRLVKMLEASPRAVETTRHVLRHLVRRIER